MSTLTENKSSATASRRLEYVTPRVNLHQNADDYTLEVELPGVGKDGVEITVEDGKLVITGHRGETAREGRTVYRERSSGEYRRVFDLDPAIDAEKISGRIEQGLLTIHLQKAEAAKPRKIAVG